MCGRSSARLWTSASLRTHLISLAGLREEALNATEEATFLAALRSGVGADRSKAAKDYVLASDLPGVKDTLQGGIYEQYRVAP